MRLNLGCGGMLKDGYVNIDAQGSVDLVHDFRNPLPYENNSVEEIYSRDVIQHFSRAEWVAIKKDWVRVLQVGGVLTIECHNFEYVLRHFLEQPQDPYWLQAIYAGQENEFDYFKNGFTYTKLVNDLKEEGMISFERDLKMEEFIHLTCRKS